LNGFGFVDGLSLRLGFVVVETAVVLLVATLSNVVFELAVSVMVPLVFEIVTEVEVLLRLSKDLFINLESCNWPELSFENTEFALEY